MKLIKKSQKTKNKLRIIYPKSHESFKNSKPKVQFYWFLYKKECSALCQNKFQLISLVECSGIGLSYSITHQSH